MLTASTLQKTVYTIDEANGQRLPIMSNVHVIPSDSELSLVGAAEIAAMDSGKTIYYTFRFPIGSRLEGFVRYIPHGSNAVYIAGAKTLASVNASLARIQNDAIARNATGGWLSNNIGLVTGIVAAGIAGVGIAGALSPVAVTSAPVAAAPVTAVPTVAAASTSTVSVAGMSTGLSTGVAAVDTVMTHTMTGAALGGVRAAASGGSGTQGAQAGAKQGAASSLVTQAKTIDTGLSAGGFGINNTGVGGMNFTLQGLADFSNSIKAGLEAYANTPKLVMQPQTVQQPLAVNAPAGGVQQVGAGTDWGKIAMYGIGALVVIVGFKALVK